MSWTEGVWNTAAEHEGESRGAGKAYHRRFRFPRGVNEEEIVARYTHGIREVTLPVTMPSTVSGREIEVHA